MSSQSGKTSLPLSLRNHALFLTAAVIAPVAAIDANAADPAANSTNSPSKMAPTVVEASPLPEMTSPKFTQPILDTPQTLVVVPREVFAQQSAVSLSDVLRNTPGISFAAGEGGNVASGDAFFMRGFDASGNIFVDGVRNTGAVTRDIYNVEQVEIAKGPAGADNGRGGSSGYVNLSTKTPRLDPSYGAGFMYGSAEVKRFTADVNQPLKLGDSGDWINGSAFRLNGMFQESGVPGRDYVENKGWAIAPSIAFGLSSNTRLFIFGSYNRQDNLPDSGLPVAALPGGIQTVPATGPVDQDNYYGIANSDFEKADISSINGRIEHDLNDSVTLRNQLSYNKVDRDALTTFFQNSAVAMYNPTNGLVTPRRIRAQNENEIITDQFNATAKFDTGFIGHSLSGGAEFAREQQSVPAWTAVNGPSTSIYTPDAFRVANAAQTPFQAANSPYADGRIDTLAGYLFDTMKLNKYFLLSGSVRVEHYDVEAKSVAGSTNAAAIAPTTLGADGMLVSWKGGLTFKPVENGSLYVAAANSMLPPGTTFTLSAATNNVNNGSLFDPVENRNYEAGVKWEFFKKRLSTSLAFFRSENLNNVVQDLNTLEFIQDQENIVQGIELGLSGKITEEWLVFGGLGYADSEFSAPLNSSGGGNNGSVLRFTPRLTANLWTSYRLPFGLTLGGGFNYSDSVLRSTTANPAAPSAIALPGTQAYWVFNLMAQYDFSKHFNVRLNVNNVADEFYFRLNNNGGRFYQGTPRSFLVSANLLF